MSETVAAAGCRAPARLLEYKRGSFVAFPPHTTIALVESPPVSAVPGSPYYCLGLMPWEQRWLPVLDLGTLLRAYAGPRVTVPGHVLVLAWQAAPGRPLDYGAVCAPLLVRMIEAGDSDECALPQDSDLWPWISLACFGHEGHRVPVLDTARLFGQVHG